MLRETPRPRRAKSRSTIDKRRCPPSRPPAARAATHRAAIRTVTAHVAARRHAQLTVPSPALSVARHAALIAQRAGVTPEDREERIQRRRR